MSSPHEPHHIGADPPESGHDNYEEPGDPTVLERNVTVPRYVHRSHHLGVRIEVDNVPTALEVLDEADPHGSLPT